MPRTSGPEAAMIVRGVGDPSPYLLRDERVVVAVRRHLMVLVAAFFETIGFILGALMIQTLFKYVPAVRTITMLIALAAVVRFCYLILEWRVERFVITDQRMMLVGGVLTRQVAVMPMRKVTDLTFEKPPVGQICGYGTFIVESAGQDQALSRIEYLPRANRLYLEVSDLLFGRSKASQAPELAIDAQPLADPGESDPSRYGTALSSDEHDDRYTADLARTDPQLGEKLAGVDYGVSADDVWAARLADYPTDRRDPHSGSPQQSQESLFDAMQSPDKSSRRMRERLGGLNGRGRRRDEAAATPGPIQQRPMR